MTHEETRKSKEGMVINGITVLRFSHTVREAEQSKSYYVCRCHCGREFVVGANRLYKDVLKSCGCITAKIGKDNRVLKEDMMGYLRKYRADGLSYRRIGDKLEYEFGIEVSRTTIMKRCREMGI